MKRLLFALIALACAGAARPEDWTRKVTRNADGAFVIGNPAARVKLVEYLSYTCPHCAHFSRESGAPLRRTYVARGLVSVELRNAVRDRLDFAAALAARCRGPAFVFADSEAIFAAQDALIAAAGAATGIPDEPNAGLKAIARASGLGALMARRGVTPARLDACLTTSAAQAPVLAMTREAWETRRIPGTPSFLINGRLTGGGWADIEPQLRDAGAAH